MQTEIRVSTPSRLCLFGEHLDYLGLEVIAVAINLRFSAKVSRRDDSFIRIRIRDSSIDTLNATNDRGLYSLYEFDITKPITYENNRDYLRSTVNVLLRAGYPLCGFDIQMDSDIPIGKGMCSSSTMIVVLTRALLEGIGHPDAENPEKIALLAFQAEVAEFGEPGGMMDQYASALGGLVNLSFSEGETHVKRMDGKLGGKFILFDSLQQKDTTRVLGNAKKPALMAIEKLAPYGIRSVKDFTDDAKLALIEKLEDPYRKVLAAAADNYRILLEAKELLNQPVIDDAAIGRLITKHHANLRDGLDISTPRIEEILNTAIENGALGGKINGSGGGGCGYVYAMEKDCKRIMEAIEKLGYPTKLLSQDTGVRKEN
ncbi:MAG: galactokinase family protein [Clostridia bacterium]|nr:galactokinase family protein [Clostridia bacterium]